jgi:hypothetical protein
MDITADKGMDIINNASAAVVAHIDTRATRLGIGFSPASMLLFALAISVMFGQTTFLLCVAVFIIATVDQRPTDLT